MLQQRCPRVFAVSHQILPGLQLPFYNNVGLQNILCRSLKYQVLLNKLYLLSYAIYFVATSDYIDIISTVNGNFIHLMKKHLNLNVVILKLVSILSSKELPNILIIYPVYGLNEWDLSCSKSCQCIECSTISFTYFILL